MYLHNINKSVRPTLILIGMLFVFMLSFCMLQPKAGAEGAASLSFSPASKEIKAGGDLVVKLHLNTGGEAVNAVQANVAYPLNIFDPAKSKVACSQSFSTAAQQIVNSTVKLDGTTMGLVKVACAIPLNAVTISDPFNGETDIATLTLKVRASAPEVRDKSLLRYVLNTDVVKSSTNYSAVARASDSDNILGAVSPADITIIAKGKTFSAADVNNDNVVNVYDLSILLSNFGKNISNTSNPDADINGDDIVNTTDLSILLSY